MQQKRSFLLTLSVLLLFTVFSSSLTMAAETMPADVLRIEPSFLEVELEKDQKNAVVEVTLSNNSKYTQTLELFALELEQRNELGEIALIERIDRNTALASYIELPEDSLSLPPHSSKTVQVYIHNSLDLSPGGHYAALVARFRPSDSPNLQQILPGVSSVILLHKRGGEQFHLSLVQSDIPPVPIVFSKMRKLSLLFSNEGNVHNIPRGTVSVTDLFGRRVYKGIINEGSLFVLPETRRKITVQMQQLRFSWPVMFYTLEIEGESELGNIPFQEKHAFVYIAPWVLLLPLLPLLLLGARRFWRKRKSYA